MKHEEILSNSIKYPYWEAGNGPFYHKDNVLKAMEEARQQAVEDCKAALLKQMTPMIHVTGNYPTEACAKTTVLSLGQLIK